MCELRFTDDVWREQLVRAMAKGAEEERTRIVAYLRAKAEHELVCFDEEYSASELRAAAIHIEERQLITEHYRERVSKRKGNTG